VKIAVIGANGQLGTDLCRAFGASGEEVVALNHDDIEVSDRTSVADALSKAQAEVVVNTSAMHNVPQCEEEPEKTFHVNAIGARNLAQVCNELDALLVQISTDYVFDGKKGKPYVEGDRPLPLNVYGNSKLAGEHFIQSLSNNYFILRVSGLYGTHPCRAKGLNFVELMLKLAKEREEVRVVDDEVLTPTFTEDIADQLVKLLHGTDRYGLYHATAEGSCSWYEFAREIFSISESSVALHKASPGEFPVKVRRPDYSVLENKALKELNLNRMPHWKEGLKKYFNR
jgi:dTDP-4-dehydrorhamnose reductase